MHIHINIGHLNVIMYSPAASKIRMNVVRIFGTFIPSRVKELCR